MPTAILTGPDGETRTLTVTQDTPPSGIDDRYHVVLTMADTQNDGRLVVNWEFSIDAVEVAKADHFDVVTPYLTISEVNDIWPEASAEEAVEVEAAVRHIINAHTGQSFGYATDITLNVEAHGEDALKLPRRLVRLTGLATLTAVLNPNSAIIVSDGWYIKKGWSEEVSTLETDSVYWEGEWVANTVDPGEPGYEKSGHGSIIHSPRRGPNPTPWKNDYPFAVTGDWGYEFVPMPVKEAAKLLINDYACAEILYRDRFLESIKAADWRLQFSSQAWMATGNVRADQLLSEFVLLQWAVI